MGVKQSKTSECCFETKSYKDEKRRFGENQSFKVLVNVINQKINLNIRFKLWANILP